MTLHTRIAVLFPVDVHELFAWGNENLLKIENPRSYDRQEGKIDWDAWKAAGSVPGTLYDFSTPTEGRSWTIGNEIGQGFDAIFDIEYRPDGPLYATDIYYDANYDPTPERVVDEDGEVNFAYPACYAMIGFDTAYGYSVDGIDCSQLHARYIVQLWNHILDIMPNTWDGLKGPLKWYNEFEGKWYDTLEDLTTLTRGGSDAVEWFESVVKPALASQLWLVGN